MRRPEVLRHTALVLRLAPPVIAQKMLRNITHDTVKTKELRIFQCKINFFQQKFMFSQKPKMGRHISAMKTQIFTPYQLFMSIFVFGAKFTSGKYGKPQNTQIRRCNRNCSVSLDTIFCGFWSPEVAFGAKYCVLKAVEA